MKIKKEIFFYCPILERGGILTSLAIYANHLSNSHNIKIFTSCIDKSILKKFDTKIVIINTKKWRGPLSRLISSFLVILSISRFLNQKTIIFSFQNHLLILLTNKIFFKKKILIRTNSIIPNGKNHLEYKNYNYSFLKKIIIRFYSLASHIITLSKDNVSYFKSIGISNSTCVYNYFKKNKLKRFNVNKKLNIFFIGRFTLEKDPVFFLQNLIDDKRINIHFVGSGSLENILKKISDNKENIFFHPYIENPFKIFKNKIDLLCITSKYEAIPNVLGEAMSYSIPVLAPEEVGLSRLFLSNGKFGYLYESNNPKSFKNKISIIINDYLLAIKKAKKGHASLDRFGYKKTLQIIDKIICKV
jgi:glycosyltransferase involved in cell wall biosynthesis